MKKLTIFVLFMFSPLLAFAKGPDCYTWPMNMTEVWLKNSNIVDILDLDESKTQITQLASQEIEKGLYNQIYYFVFYDKKGNSYEVITQNDASDKECSISGVNKYLVSQSKVH